GRVQLSAAIEDRLGIVQSTGLLEAVETLGELRKLVAGGGAADDAADIPSAGPATAGAVSAAADSAPAAAGPRAAADAAPAGQVSAAQVPASPAPARPAPAGPAQPARMRLVYRTWPWWRPIHWMRALYTETLQNFFTWLISKPRVISSPHP